MTCTADWPFRSQYLYARLELLQQEKDNGDKRHPEKQDTLFSKKTDSPRQKIDADVSKAFWIWKMDTESLAFCSKFIFPFGFVTPLVDLWYFFLPHPSPFFFPSLFLPPTLGFNPQSVVPLWALCMQLEQAVSYRLSNIFHWSRYCFLKSKGKYSFFFCLCRYSAS